MNKSKKSLLKNKGKSDVVSDNSEVQAKPIVKAKNVKTKISKKAKTIMEEMVVDSTNTNISVVQVKAKNVKGKISGKAKTITEEKVIDSTNTNVSEVQVKAKNVKAKTTTKISGKAKTIKEVKGKKNAIIDSTKMNEKELGATDIKKIEKKKAKKAAQKLKKSQRKAGQEASKKTDVSVSKETSGAVKPPAQKPATKKEKNIKKSKLSKDQTIADELKKTDVGNSEKSPKTTVAKDATKPVGERVLMKKERKIKKRQLLKEQKLAEKSTRDPATDEATVFVGNLPVNTKRVQLIKHFQKYGPVSSIRLRSAGGKILHKHKQKRAAGSLNAYVVLSSKSSAEEALQLNGSEFKGIHLRVTKSLKEVEAPEMNDEAKRTVFVGNLKYSATEESLRETFTSCGEVEYVRCIRDGDKGCKGVAFVRFKSTDAVGLALELNETIMDERPINVERFSTKKLGAKEQRDAQAAKENKNKPPKGKGKDDNSKRTKNPNAKSKPNQKDDESKKAKKSEFRGVKVEALKKKLKMKKKKSTNQALNIAKKIAPRPKKEE